MVSDIQLIEKVLSGDNSAFDVLVARYSKQVRTMLEKRNVGPVDDVLQEMFLKVYLNLEKYDRRYSFCGWIMTIAKNLSIDMYRRSNDTLSLENGTEEIHSVYPSPEQLVVRAQQAAAIDSVIDKLPEKYRTVLILRFDYELSYKEIAEKLNMQIGTVKTNLHRARAALMSMMSL